MSSKKKSKTNDLGEDSGKIGDVNQGLEGLQQKFGEERLTPEFVKLQ